ncbi:Kelch repeat-containing protein [Agromyces bracchium]|uniref:Kelch repeat-containing protein n=1 Tax=Agromyces bracchium TaxID=88376 RepID=UPI0018AD0E2A|nr:kelch repeat-containing protein [Agromyces bracchium]
MLFGGRGSELLGDTWELADDLWTQVEDFGPAPRTGCAMVFDPSRSNVILFGGTSDPGLMGDTWRWDGSTWTQVEDSGPSPRSWHTLAYHGASERIVLFGGRTETGPDAETWGWDGQSWTLLADLGPSPRQAHAMSDGLSGGNVLLFGGADSAAQGLADTWAWDGVAWTQLADTGPSPRAGAAMASVGGSVALFGGVDSLKAAVPPADHLVHGDTWQWVGAGWTQVQDIGPEQRWLHSLTVDPKRERLMLFGGMSEFTPITSGNAAGSMGDTWSHLDSFPGSRSTPVPGYGVIHASCGVLPLRLGEPAPSTAAGIAFDFGDQPFDDQVDRLRLTVGAQRLLAAPNAGGGALLGEIVAMEVLARCEGATLLKTKNEIVYDTPGATTDLLLSIAERNVGVRVLRAFTFPFGAPYQGSTAEQALSETLRAINESTENVAIADAWAKQLLVVVAYDQQHADTILTSWERLAANLTTSTVLYVIVTEGRDEQVYVSS